MNSRQLVACVMATFLTVPLAARAAEITLFEGPNFQGRSMTFHGEASNLDPFGFNDHASSAIVREGTWEGCSDAYFRGRCAQLAPGEYAQLDGGLNRSISSLRVLSWDPAYRSGSDANRYPPPYPYPQAYASPYRDRGYYGYPYHDHGQ